MNRISLIVASFGLAASVGMGSNLIVQPANAGTSVSSDAELPPTSGVASRVVRIAGSDVRITVSAVADVLPPRPVRPLATVQVLLAPAGDSTVLPANLSAERVRLIRPSVGPNRVFVTDLEPEATVATVPQQISFFGIDRARLNPGAQRDAVVRLRLGDRILLIPVGRLTTDSVN